jgi:hypothetical protein
MRRLTLAALIFVPGPVPADELTTALADYRAALAELRAEFGGSRPLPDERFFLFGMGGRPKLVYQAGRLWDARTGDTVRSWEVADELIVPPAYTVRLTLRDGRTVTLAEDEDGVWLTDAGGRTALACGPVKLPTFAGRRYAPVLRVLHQEVLVNVVDGKPVPNLFAYPRPWHRDAALMAMVLDRTGNLAVLKDWVLGLRDPYDRNNKGIAEPDNLGQVLYLVSLVGDRSHPVVRTVLDELPKVTKDRHLTGKSDFAPHPVYQTKWLKFGLARLGLPDDYVVPVVADSYSPLVWWAYREQHVKTTARHLSDDYPYLTWADDHFYGQTRGKVSDRDYPLTWEARASEADYTAVGKLSPRYAAQKLAAPHTWHAAEMFLLLIDRK